MKTELGNLLCLVILWRRRKFESPVFTPLHRLHGKIGVYLLWMSSCLRWGCYKNPGPQGTVWDMTTFNRKHSRIASKDSSHFQKGSGNFQKQDWSLPLPSSLLPLCFCLYISQLQPSLPSPNLPSLAHVILIPLCCVIFGQTEPRYSGYEVLGGVCVGPRSTLSP